MGLSLVYGFICLGLLKGKGVSERAREPPPGRLDLSWDWDEGRAEKDSERGRKDASPQLSDEWVPKIEEVYTHHWDTECW